MNRVAIGIYHNGIRLAHVDDSKDRWNRFIRGYVQEHLLFAMAARCKG